MRGWEELRRADGLERDAHDKGEATHLLVVRRNAVRGHARLIPGGYLRTALADPERVSCAVGNASLYGLSRFCFAPEEGGLLRQPGYARLFLASIEHAISAGGRMLMLGTDPFLVFVLRLIGFDVHVVGDTVQHAGRAMQPIIIDLQCASLADLRKRMAAWKPGGIEFGELAEA